MERQASGLTDVEAAQDVLDEKVAAAKDAGPVEEAVA
jgi:hypothetical protein